MSDLKEFYEDGVRAALLHLSNDGEGYVGIDNVTPEERNAFFRGYKDTIKPELHRFIRE